MASRHLTGTRHTTTPHLDGYLDGIRNEFDRLSHELDATRKQRDEYITKYKNKVEELRELRKTISRREEHTVFQHGQDASRDTEDNPLISPVSSSSEYHSSLEEEDAAIGRLHGPGNAEEIEGERNREGTDVGGRDGSYQNEINVEPTVAGIVSHSPESDSTSTNKPEDSAWEVEYNSVTTPTLELNLVHKLTQMQRTYVAFSMDGKYLATAYNLGMVSIYDSKTGKRIMHSAMKNLCHEEESLPEYKCLCFSPDSKYLATGGEDGKIRIWVISQRRVRNTFGHRDAVTSLNFSPNGQSLVTCSFDKTVRIWRLRDGSSRVLTTFEVLPWSVRCSPDGQYIVSGSSPNSILIWNMRTGKLVTRWNGHSYVVASLVFTPDGKGLLSGSWDKQIIHWDVTSLGSLGIADRLRSDMMEISRFLGHTANVHTVSISPDGKWIASGSFDKTVRIWSVHGSSLHCVLHCPGWVWSVDFSPVGNFLAIGGDFQDVTIWNYANL